MKQFSKNLFSHNVTSDEEFDELVSELLHVEPPPSLVNNILSSVAKIPFTQHEAEQRDLEEVQDGLIIRHKLVQPS